MGKQPGNLHFSMKLCSLPDTAHCADNHQIFPVFFGKYKTSNFHSEITRPLVQYLTALLLHQSVPENYPFKKDFYLLKVQHPPKSYLNNSITESFYYVSYGFWIINYYVKS